jgi:hypothetical protein
VDVWEKQGGRDVRFNKNVKDILVFTEQKHVDLKLHLILSCDNVADKPSRSLSLQDCQLSEASWRKIQSTFSPHSVDLMVLDSNVMVDEKGEKLRYFSQGSSPLSSGENTFSQDLSLEENPYVFPLFCLNHICSVKVLGESESKEVHSCSS